MRTTLKTRIFKALKSWIRQLIGKDLPKAVASPLDRRAKLRALRSDVVENRKEEFKRR